MENPVIQIHNLKKSFKNQEVLKGIHLEVKAGEVIGYLGSNGAGKSTTVKILCGVLHDFEGDIHILGHDLRQENTAIKKRIGYIPENAVMYEQLTPMEYLEFTSSLYGLSPDVARQKSYDLLELFEMKNFRNDRMLNFSKGMKQKIHIISGLLHHPDLLFMDEPLNGLDANAVIMVKEMISQLSKEGKTIFYCSHLMDIVERISSRIILLNEGQIIADGTIEALKKESDSSSLEHLFSKRTGMINPIEKAEKIIHIFEKENQ